ncbi:hypothetical protein ACTFIR_011660 [Dictyostelium discoideum]
MRLFYLIFFLIVSTIINGCNSQIQKNDYDCLNKLIVKIANLSLYKLNSTSKQYDYCGTKNNNVINCNSNGRITDIQLTHFVNKATNLISANDYYCFPFLKSIGVDSFRIEKNFIYGPFPDSLDVRIFLLNGNLLSVFNVDTEIGFNNTIKRTQIDTFRLVGGVATSLNTTVYMSTISHFKNIEFIYGTAAITNKTNFIFENDLNENKKSSFKEITSYCSNIPPLSYNNETINFVELTLLPSFDKESVSNFSSYSNVLDIYLNSWDPNQVFPFPLGLSNIPPNNKLIYIYTNYLIDSPPHLIDLSNLDSNDKTDTYSYNTLTLNNPGNLFNFNGKFPFSSLHKNLVIFNFNGGNFSELPKLEDVFKEEISVINLNNNSIGGNVQTTLDFDKLPNLATLNLRNNRLTGSIDESWCRINFDISYNLIGGEAPSCMVCHFQGTDSSILGINFTNWNPKPPCTSIIPNLIYDNSTNLLLIYGQDIGFARTNFKIENSYNYSPYCSMPGYPDIRNRQFCFKYIDTDEPNPFSFNITYPKLPPGSRTTFELAAYNMFLPLVNKAIMNSKESLTIVGRYFAYNKTVINVQVDGKICIIESCDFNEIKCKFSNDNNNNNFNGLNVFVQIMNVSSQFCISKCNAADNYECEFKFERCNCSEEWEGDDCSIKIENKLSNSNRNNILNTTIIFIVLILILSSF